MSKQISIKINEPQPLPCLHCKGYNGYQYSDSFRIKYTSIHLANGEYEGGEYNDDTLIHKAKTAYCANCGTVLPFTLDRGENENVEDNKIIYENVNR